MSVTVKMSCSHKQLLAFIASEIRLDTGLPVHPFSAVNSLMAGYDRSTGIADDKGAFFFTAPKTMTAYGKNDWTGLLRALRRCGVKITFVD